MEGHSGNWGGGVMAGDVIKKVDNKAVLKILNRKEVIKKVDVSQGVLLDAVRQRRPYLYYYPTN